MFQRLLTALAWGALAALVACAPAATPAPTATPVPPTAPPTPTAAPRPTDPPAAPQPGQSLFPPVGAADWQFGPATAAITIVEYGDFQ